MNNFTRMATVAMLCCAAPAAIAGDRSVSPVQPFPTTDNVPGADDRSVLTRLSSSLRIDVRTSGLDPASPYTLWAVIFNKPQYCHSSPCSMADLPVSPGHDPRVEATIVFAGGGVADTGGRGAFLGRVFRSTEGLAIGERIAGIGRLDLKRAEVHVVVRGHGYPEGQEVFAAISSFAGGCDAANPCEDQQFAVHTARGWH